MQNIELIEVLGGEKRKKMQQKKSKLYTELKQQSVWWSVII